MDLTITDETDDRLQFDMERTTPAFANALRRTMMGNIDTLAVEDVHITANNSGLFDEMIAHRLGLLPWEFEPGKYTRRDECDCEDGCAKCTVSMVLEKEGPATVTQSDIAVGDDEVAPAEPDAVILELKDEAELSMELTAQLGRGKEHAKWQAANAAYEYNDDDVFHFTVDQVAGLSPRTLVAEALAQLNDELDDFEDSLDEAL